MKIQVNGNNVLVDTPYHPAFPDRAKALGGRWDPATRTWRFDARDEARVRELVASIYGTEDEPRVTVRIRADLIGIRGDTWYALGRMIAHRPSRDSAVRFGDGVVLTAGGFWPSGGSRNNPVIDEAQPGTVLEVRDVPLSIARHAVDAKPGYLSWKKPEEGEPYEIVDAAADCRAALEAEAARLRARLAEIEAELANLS